MAKVVFNTENYSILKWKFLLKKCFFSFWKEQNLFLFVCLFSKKCRFLNQYQPAVHQLSDPVALLFDRYYFKPWAFFYVCRVIYQKREEWFIWNIKSLIIVKEIQSKISQNFMLIRITHQNLLHDGDFFCFLLMNYYHNHKIVFTNNTALSLGVGLG